MTQSEIILLDVQQCQESLSQRSDVYNSVRVVIRPIPYLKVIHVMVKGTTEPKEFNLNENAVLIADYISETTQTLKQLK